MKDSAGSRPHIVIVVENLPVPLDRRVWQESEALRDAGYDVTVICPQMRGYHAPRERIDGIEIRRHWIAKEAGSFAGFLAEYASALWGELFLLVQLWRERPFQCIHLCNPPDLLFLVAWPFRLLGVRVIYDVHDLWPEMFEAKFGGRGPAYWLVRLAERCTLALAHVVLATNESVRQIVLARGHRRESDVFVVRTSPKIGNVNRAPDSSLKKNRQFLVGYVGVMGDADGVEHLIRTAAEIVHRLGRTDVHFLLMGTGPEYARLVDQRDALSLGPFVDMPGRVSDEFLFTALATIDLGVSVDPKNSYNDHCTMNKVLEYMAFGKAQVMFDLIEGRASAGDASAYVSSGNVPALAAEILRLLKNSAERGNMGAVGKARLQEILGWERSVENLLAAYRRALA